MFLPEIEISSDVMSRSLYLCITTRHRVWSEINKKDTFECFSFARLNSACHEIMVAI